MKKMNRNNTRVWVSAAVLLLLAVLALWKMTDFPGIRQAKPDDSLEDVSGTPEISETDDLSAGSAEEDKIKTEDPNTASSSADKPDTQAGTTELSAEEQKQSFLPDYTSAPLLNTTAIRDLSMEIGSSETELHFNWLSPSAKKGQVRLTDTASGETTTFSSECFTSASVPGYYVNKAVVQGLTPGASYQYQVGNEDAWSPEYPYQCPDTDSETLTFLVTADAQIGQSDMEEPSVTAERWDSVLTRLISYVPEASFLFHLGDQVADYGNEEQYAMFLDHLALYRIPLAPAAGNHDVPNPTSMEENGHPAAPYFFEHFHVPNRSSTGQSQYDQDGNYYFIRGNVLFIVLNSSTVQGSAVQEQYVAQIVSEHPDTQWRILAQHFPAYPASVRSHTDCKEYLARIAESNDIDLVLGAHDHVYSRTGFVNGLCEALPGYSHSSGSTAINPEGTLYITCSTSSGCLYHEPEEEIRTVNLLQPYAPMALRFDATDTELRMRAYQVDTWEVADEYTIRKE